VGFAVPLRGSCSTKMFGDDNATARMRVAQAMPGLNPNAQP
jgi:hypothetical protein